MQSSRTLKARKNVAMALALQMTKMVLTFVSRIVFVRILGATYLGVNGLFSNVLSILSVADLGMYTVMMYSLYKPLADKDDRKISAYVNFFNRVYSVIAIIVGALGMAIIPFLKYIVNLPENIDHIYLYYLLMLANIVLGYLFIYKTTILRADQKSHILDRIDFFTQIGLFVAQLAILLVSKNYTFYLLSGVISTLIANIIKSHSVNRQYGNAISKKSDLKKEEKKELVDNIKSLFLYKIGSVLQSNTDNILISIFVGTLVVGYYSNYTMVILAITSLISMIFSSLKASIGNYNVEKSKSEQAKLFYFFEDYSYILIAFCSVCFYVILPYFIKVFFGGDYLLDKITLIFIILNFYTSNIRQNIWVYRETTGMFSKVKYITLVTTALNVVLSIIGGQYFGITGIIAATVISRMLFAWWKEPMVLFRHYFKTNAKKYFSSYILKIVYTLLVCFIIERAIALINIDNRIVDLAIKSSVAAIMAGVLIIIPFIKTESFKYLISKNKMMMNRRAKK